VKPSCQVAGARREPIRLATIDVYKRQHQDVALGADGLRAMLLAEEGLDRSISELRQEAERELDSLTEQRGRLLVDSFPGREIAEVRRELERDHYTEDTLISGADGLLEELRAFVEQNAEVPIPEGPKCEVRPSPGFMTAWVSAAYEGCLLYTSRCV